MKNMKKRGFTIVELVIVIAVIAILAAVLIPTFSNVIGTANLSSDKQAVREMNMALAEWEASNGYPDRNTLKIEDAMRIIADAGYDVESWNPLTAGYQVYWYKTDNRCVLYNITEKKVEYPAEYTNASLTDPNNAGKFYVYNQTFKKAIAEDLNFSSSANKNVTVGDVTYDSALVNTYGDTVNYASAIVYQDDAHPTTFSVTVKTNSNPSAEDIKSAQKAAGAYVYALFQQANEKLITVDEILIEPGTTIDISDTEWKPIKTFGGYFGVKDADCGFDATKPIDEQPDTYKPVVIKGLGISSALGFSETFVAKGTNNPIYLTGFIGAIYGEGKVENVRFEDVTIDHAAMNRLTSSSGKDASNSAIIGGIIAGDVTVYDENGVAIGNKCFQTAEVTIRNIVVDGCTIGAVRRAGGLIGFVGGTTANGEGFENLNNNDVAYLKGNITIDNCVVKNTKVDTDALLNAPDYAAVGGIIGFINKEASTLAINISNCKVTDSEFNGKATISGGIVGSYSPVLGGKLTITDCSVSGNTNNGAANNVIVNVGKIVHAGDVVVNGETITVKGAIQ